MKGIRLILPLLMVLVLFTGCGNKEAITAKEFQKQFSDMYTINVKHNDYWNSEDARITGSKDEPYLAYVPNGCVFSELTSEQSAKTVYMQQSALYQHKSDTTSQIVQIKGGNYEALTVETESNYSYICRVSNTVLWYSGPMKDSIRQIAEEIGYYY